MQVNKGRQLRRHAGYLAIVILTVVVAVVSEHAVAQKPFLGASRPQVLQIEARPLMAFDRPSAGRKKFGRLEWRGGLVLTSSNTNFGGWSGLVLDEDGQRLLAVSDAGTWMTGEMTYENDRPTGIRNAKISSLMALGGRPLSRARDRDAESVALAAGTLEKGTVLVSFEDNPRIGRFRISNGELSPPLEYLSKPAEARRMSRNASFESIGVLKGGRYKGAVIAFAERYTDKRDDHTGWLWIDGQPQPLYLSDRDGFDITDMAPLRDGSVIVLERRFRWTEGVKMRLRLLGSHDIAPGARMEGETLFEADMSYEIDNMEGVAVHYSRSGETIVTVLSDNNFNSFLQRTILLQFTLLGTSTVSAHPPKRNP